MKAHLLTKRHTLKIVSIEKIKLAKNEFSCKYCNKQYKTRSGLWKHQKNCELSSLGNYSVPVSKNSENSENDENEENVENITPAILSDEKYAEMGASEQFVLSISNNGYGKRTSTFEYRVTGRGGKGIIAMVVNDRNGNIADSFPVDSTNQIILVTNNGKLIRCPVDDIRIASRSTQGVKIFDVDDQEQVVSVERLGDLESDEDDGADDE